MLADALVMAVKQDTMDTGRSLELLPKLLNAIATTDRIEMSRGATSGATYKDHFLDRLCAVRAEWPESCVVAIIKILRDIPMGSKQLSQVIDKVRRS